MKLLILIFVVYFVRFAIGLIAGHLKPLGEQRKSEGHVEIVTDIPDTVTFYENYIKASKPVVLKGAAHVIPAFHKWTDDYLKEKFGELDVEVEEGKKENRSLGMWSWAFKEFLDRYQKEDVYMVNSLKSEMKGDLVLFPSISCGGYSNVLLDVVMWFSSGGTKSVVHIDMYDNINCLFSGTKRLYMVHHDYQDLVAFDVGSYSNVDVDAVDLNKYPGFAEAPWWEAKMEAGDCLFIPSRWIHQVRSYTEYKRNMAVNMWFYHLIKLNYTDCEINGNHNIPLDKFTIDEYKGLRFLLKLEVEDRALSYREMLSALRVYNYFILIISIGFRRSQITKMEQHAPKIVRVPTMFYKQALLLLDKDENKMISIEDIELLTEKELKQLFGLFPGFLLKSDEDDEEDIIDDDETNDYKQEL